MSILSNLKPSKAKGETVEYVSLYWPNCGVRLGAIVARFVVVVVAASGLLLAAGSHNIHVLPGGETLRLCLKSAFRHAYSVDAPTSLGWHKD